MQQIHHHRRDARAVLHRRRDVFGEGRARFSAAMAANAGVRAVFRDNGGLGFGKVVHLARGVAGDRRPSQRAAASSTGLRKMIDGGIGIRGAAQGFARVAFLSAGLLAGSFAQAADPGPSGFLFQPVA